MVLLLALFRGCLLLLLQTFHFRMNLLSSRMCNCLGGEDIPYIMGMFECNRV